MNGQVAGVIRVCVPFRLWQGVQSATRLLNTTGPLSRTITEWSAVVAFGADDCRLRVGSGAVYAVGCGGCDAPFPRSETGRERHPNPAEASYRTHIWSTRGPHTDWTGSCRAAETRDSPNRSRAGPRERRPPGRARSSTSGPVRGAATDQQTEPRARQVLHTPEHVVRPGRAPP